MAPVVAGRLVCPASVPIRSAGSRVPAGSWVWGCRRVCAGCARGVPMFAREAGECAYLFWAASCKPVLICARTPA
jgi:hypothetical protein